MSFIDNFKIRELDDSQILQGCGPYHTIYFNSQQYNISLSHFTDEQANDYLLKLFAACGDIEPIFDMAGPKTITNETAHRILMSKPDSVECVLFVNDNLYEKLHAKTTETYVWGLTRYLEVVKLSDEDYEIFRSYCKIPKGNWDAAIFVNNKNNALEYVRAKIDPDLKSLYLLDSSDIVTIYY